MELVRSGRTARGRRTVATSSRPPRTSPSPRRSSRSPVKSLIRGTVRSTRVDSPTSAASFAPSTGSSTPKTLLAPTAVGDLVRRRVVRGGVEQQAVARRPERDRRGEEGGGRRRVARQPGQGEPGPEPAGQPAPDQPRQQCGGHRGDHDRRGGHRREREGRCDRVELRAPAVGADRAGAGQREHGAAPRDPAGRDHRPARGPPVAGEGVGGGGHDHRGEHDAARPARRRAVGAPTPSVTHDGGHERAGWPTSRRAARARPGSRPRRG